MRTRYNTLGFLLLAALVVLVGWLLLADAPSDGRQPGTTPATRDGAQNVGEPP